MSDLLDSYSQVPLPNVLQFKVPVCDAKFSGPISGPMWERVSKLRSSYPDDFDYSVYDRLHRKFGKNLPRGGVLFKTALRLMNAHASCQQCHYALEIDTYGRGCVFNCAYCYAKEQLSKHKYWNEPHPFPLDISLVRKAFSQVFETDKSSRWRSILERRIPIRIGSMSDSFMWMDKTFKVTHELLRILNHYQYPHIIFTRSDLIAEDEYLNILNPKLAAVQFSISGNNPELTRKLEPGAPSVARRLSALKKLVDQGFWTAVRVNPLFPTYPDGYFTDKEYVRKRFGDSPSVPNFPFLDIDRVSDFVASISEAGVPTVIAGFARLSVNAIANIRRQTGIDLLQFYRPELHSRADDRRFSDSEIAFYYKRMQWECAKRGLRFSTCYIGNGEKDYFQYQSIWDNPKDCCDVVSNLSSFSTTCQEIPVKERLRHLSRPSPVRKNRVIGEVSKPGKKASKTVPPQTKSPIQEDRRPDLLS